MNGGRAVGRWSRRKLWLVVAVLAAAGGAAVFATLTYEGTGTMCTLAGAHGPVGSTPEEAAQRFVEARSGSATDADRMHRFEDYERHDEAEWRRPIGPDGWEKLTVGRTDDGTGWQVTGANECSRVEV